MGIWARVFLVLALCAVSATRASAEEPIECAPLHDRLNELRGEGERIFGRTICADLVAMDQMLVYNRFGSFNPFGMLYALRRDVVNVATPVERLDADACDGLTGVESYGEDLEPGKVRLRDCKRPRPLTLRANVGDVLHVRLSNMLRPLEGAPRGTAPDLSRDFCDAQETASSSRGGLFRFLRDWVSWGDATERAHGEVTCGPEGSPEGAETAEPYIPGWPHSRGANMAIQGLTAFEIRGGRIVEAPDACKGLGAIAPGASVDCYYMIEREGPFFMASTGAPAGGEGDGGSIAHGLFGAVVAERRQSRWYRSQLTRAGFDTAFPPANGATLHARQSGALTSLAPYETTIADPVSGRRMPVLNMLRRIGRDTFELVHSDLNAVVHQPGDPEGGFREFSVFFHDELKTFYTRNFEELGDFAEGQLAGVRDGFAINYGSSGMGDMVLANRKGIGPSANCQECLYEEFFLTSWANGDPALLEQFGDDPSNVHHSYLNDRVVFRNFHAGPKETHVFHLHAHQWFAGNDGGRGSYLDSQTVGPQQGFTYDIYDGGLEVYHKGAGGAPGWFETLGSGNRNRTVGDSIFHCHLYPHFAQGMWELWRVHDVLEDGTRKLPDGQWEPTLSLAEMSAETRGKKRPGSVDAASGRLVTPGDGLTDQNLGTPIPAIVPVPGQPWPVLPTYAEGEATLEDDGDVTGAAEAVAGTDTPEALSSFPGYPFYIAGRPGHRPPQAPMDIARALSGGEVTDGYLDGGLPRHVMTDDSRRKLPFILPEAAAGRLAEDPAPETLVQAQGDADLADREALQAQVIASALALGDMTLKLEEATLDLLPYDGTALERSAMAFHHDGSADGGTLDVRAADGTPTSYDPGQGGYTSTGGGVFAVNSSAPKPGAPFADPCGAPETLGTLKRSDTGDYLWSDGTGDRAVFVDAALSEPATDAEVTNWVYFLRGPGSARPQLFVDNGAGGASALPSGGQVSEADPFLRGLPGIDGFGDIAFTPDPAVVGYRRYEASAVQVDMVTNRAGWHDPQARINVLSGTSDRYKEGGGKISPKITASEEPFFFRALSGECIEFRHTNELPKELELDDFQVKTPTDTIGQHIHLVKFDVTSSDGSGNGFNYEDGTFAPGEIAARICAAKNTDTAADILTSRPDGALKIREFAGLCTETDGTWHVSDEFDHKIWEKKLSEFRDLFQTTTQRWFADPVLSNLRLDDPGQGRADRTLRTVFSHDHFGPSSIQQHGFYTALVIEPQNALVCDEESIACTEARDDRSLVEGGEDDVGARKVIVDLLPLEAQTPDPANALAHREFAVSIADFATLYDPRGAAGPAELEAALSTGAGNKGMATLACEARHADDPAGMAANCGSALSESSSTWQADGGNVPPAWLAQGRPGDLATHQDGVAPQLFSQIEVPQGTGTVGAADSLEAHLKTYRAKAAGFADAEADGVRYARPVAPPARPESISVDHHDPYLVNYRGQPFPIRVGTSSSASSDCDLQPLGYWVAALELGVDKDCEISRQKAGAAGDMANVLVSGVHGDPVVPILNTFDGETLQFRLIQGAQEVQHNFTVEGYTWTRNFDQRFPSMMRPRDEADASETLDRACHDGHGAESGLQIARAGRPEEYNRWAAEGLDAFTPGTDAYRFWADTERQIAGCFNAHGRITSQEIGISEHFEFKSAFLYDSNLDGLRTYLLRSLRAEIPAEAALEELRQRLEELQDYDVLAPRDTPYHFGSQDSQWNGAWGLVRVRQSASRINRLQELVAEFEELIADIDAGRGVTDDGVLDAETAERFSDLASPEIDDLLEVPAARPNAPVDLPRPLDDASTFVTTASDDPDRIQQSTTLPPLGAYEKALAVQREGLDLRDRLGAGAGIQADPDADRDDDEGYSRVAQCDDTAPRVHVAIAAIESETVFPGGPVGTPYSNELRDYDGLFFALVDPRRLIEPEDVESVDEEALGNRDNWTAIPRSRIIELIRQTYERPEPLVVNVKAGDCVNVTLLNALSHTAEGDGPARQDMVDRPGDARMTPITSLDTERDWVRVEEGQQPVDAHDIAASRRTDVAPSARLAVTLPLPVLTCQSAYGRPYGQNPVVALDGVPGSQDDPVLTIRSSMESSCQSGSSDQVAQIEQFEFYAGLAHGRRQSPTANPLMQLSRLAPELRQIPVALNPRLTLDTVIEDLGARRGILAERIGARLDRLLPEARAPGRRAVPDVERRIARTELLAPILRSFEPDAMPATDERMAVPIGDLARRLEREATVDPQRLAEALEPLRPDLEALTVREDRAAVLLSALEPLVVDYKPYAFGALPLKSFGDLIGHPAHGLIGAVTVAPQNARLSQERVQRLGFGGEGCNRLLIDRFEQPLIRERTLESLLGQPLSRVDPGQVPQIRDLLGRGRICRSFVLAPRGLDDPARFPAPISATTLKVEAPDGSTHRIWQVTLFWQDGLNMRDVQSANSWKRSRSIGRFDFGDLRDLLRARPELGNRRLRDLIDGDMNRIDRRDISDMTLRDLMERRPEMIERRSPRFEIDPDLFGPRIPDIFVNPTPTDRTREKIVADCLVCDDSYDVGEAGISYLSEPFNVRLRGWQGNETPIERHYDFNPYEFGSVTDPADGSASFFRLADDELPAWQEAPVPVLRAVAGEEMVVHVVHPGGRARQRAFATIGQDYDDLFPGFGFPRAALLGPGKALTASFRKKLETGCYLFFDGSVPIRSGGVWGLIDVVSPEALVDAPLVRSRATSCRRPDR